MTYFPEDLIAIKVGAHKLHITPNNIYIRHHHKTFPIKIYMIGRRLFISSADVDEFISSGGWSTLAEKRNDSEDNK